MGVIIARMMDEIIEEQLGILLRQNGLKLATAESCTGGLIGDRITNIPGSSDYFLGGVVSYAYEAKVKLLSVSWDTLHKFGAVSRETVLEMARGVRLVLDADIGLAVSGIAGPGGGLPNKPVGTTWIGLSSSDGGEAWIFHFAGERRLVKDQAADQAFHLLVDHLSGFSKIGVVQEFKFMQIEVRALFDERGQAQPQEFVWDAVIYTVVSSGRRWQDEAGQHILVMDHKNIVYELIFSPESKQWYLSGGELPPGRSLSS